MMSESPFFVLSLSHFARANVTFTLKKISSFYCSDVVKKIDQSEFEGFEYINPLLMSAEECV